MPSTEQTLLTLASELKGTYPPAELAQLVRPISPAPRCGEMSAEDFEDLRQILIAQNNRRSYSDKSITAARLVLVMGASIAEAAQEVGLARQVVHRLMVRIRRRMAAVPSDWVKISEWYSRDIAEQMTTLVESLKALKAAGSPLPLVSFIRTEHREERANARDELIARYKAYREGWEKPDLKVKERYQLVAAHCQAMKGEVRRSYPDPLLRKLMYRVAEFERMKATAALRIALREERQALAAQGLLRPLTYRPWVEQQALAGDVAAVSQLRGIAYREKRKKRLTVEQRDRTIFAGRADDTGLRNVNSHTTQLHRDGTIEYLRDRIVGVVDHGGRVEIKPGHMDYDDSVNYRLAAHLASRKSGEWLEAVGDDEFLTRLFDAAVNMNRHAGQDAFLPTEPYQREQFVEFERDHRLYYGEPVQAPSRPVRGPDPVDDVVVKPSYFPRP